jgi:hypothetical protein
LDSHYQEVEKVILVGVGQCSGQQESSVKKKKGTPLGIKKKHKKKKQKKRLESGLGLCR